MKVSLPRYNLAQIERTRDRLLTNVFRRYFDSEVELDVLAKDLKSALPNLSYDVVFESVRSLAGVSLTPAVCARFSWRMAGNMSSLKQGVAMTPWTLQRADEWAPAIVTRMERMRTRKGTLGYEATCKILAGTATLMRSKHFWSSKAIKAVAREMGFSNWGTYKMRNAMDIVGLRLFLHLTIANSDNLRPGFWEVHCPSSMVSWNRDNVLKLRLRVGQRCPEGFTHKCHKCAIGYDQCPAGTHYRTYERGECISCSKESVFDPEDISGVCVMCAESERVKKHE